MKFAATSALLLVLPTATLAGWKPKFCILNEEQPCNKVNLGVEGPIPPGEYYQARMIGKLMSEFAQRRDFAPNMRRSFHPNQHGCPKGYFKLNEDLPRDLDVVPFVKGKKYLVTSSFATSGPFYVPDNSPFEKSLAIKIHGVGGRKLQVGYENEDSIDFLMNGSETFFTPDVFGFYQLLNYLVQHNDASLSQYVQDNPENGARLAELSTAVHALGSVFDNTYFSQTPYRWGKRKAIKFRMKPRVLSGKSPPTTPEGYLDEAKDQLSAGKVCFDFQIQEQEDPCAQPIEDATVKWGTEYKTVGEVCFDQQVLPIDGDGSEEDLKCRNSFFQPWLTTKQLRPLGGLNRARLHPYREVGEDRQAFNGFADANVNQLELDNELSDFEARGRRDC